MISNQVNALEQSSTSEATTFALQTSKKVMSLISGTPTQGNCIGDWSAWTNGGECEVTCGGGVLMRTFSLFSPASVSSGDCLVEDGDVEALECNTEPCPEDCDGSWGEWSECPVTCGGSSTFRKYSVLTNGSLYGVPCEAENDTVESAACGMQNCNGTSPKLTTSSTFSTVSVSTETSHSLSTSSSLLSIANSLAIFPDANVIVYLPNSSCIDKESQESTTTQPCSLSKYNISLTELFQELGLNGVESVAIYPQSIMIENDGSIQVS